MVEAAEAETQEMLPSSVLCSENSSTEEGRHTGSILIYVRIFSYPKLSFVSMLKWVLCVDTRFHMIN